MALIRPALLCPCCLSPIPLLNRQKQDSLHCQKLLHRAEIVLSLLHTSHSLEYRCSFLSNWLPPSALQFCLHKLLNMGLTQLAKHKSNTFPNSENCFWCFYQLSHCQAKHQSTLYFSSLLKTSERPPFLAQITMIFSISTKTYQRVLFLHGDEKWYKELPSIIKTRKHIPRTTCAPLWGYRAGSITCRWVCTWLFHSGLISVALTK